MQRCLHAVETLKFDEAGAHELVVLLVRAHADLERLDFLEVGFDSFLGGGEGEVA